MRTGASELRLLVVCTLAPVFVSACSQSADAPEPLSALAELEQFAFVPQGTSQLPSGTVSSAHQPSIGEPLLVGMYEVTRAEYRQYIDAARPALDALLEQRIENWSTADDALPVSFITRDEAGGYAHWAGMRLLTSDEWLFCAMSPRALAYPWSDTWQQGRANTIELGRLPYAPTLVGTFEGGGTATHIYDMLGNVWEWVADGSAEGASSDAGATAFGGSYMSYKQQLRSEWIHESLSAGARLEDLGFRVCAPARAWLETHAAELQRAKDVRPRLIAVGRRWGSGAVPLLSELSGSSQSATARTSLDAILSGARG